MLTFTLKRLGSGVLLLAVISAIAYALLFASGTNIARNILGETATEEQVLLKQQELGLDRPLWEQYGDWVTSAITGDLGRSWFGAETVAGAVASRLPVTLTLIVAAILLTALLATALGVTAAVKRGWVDRTLQVSAVVGDAIPGFVLAIALVFVFALQLRLLPAISTIAPGAGAQAWITSLSLPIIAIVVNAVTSSAQQIRSAVIAQYERDFVRTLRSRGLGEREILLKHVLRGASPAGLTVLSLQFIGMLGGVVIIERIFAIPGIGNLAVTATQVGDVPIVMGVVLYTVVIVVIVNLLVDLLNGWLNPKVRVA
ncbi:ABC transporter permease [Agrococcus jejuensis]|uniref:Peptide/nickel transport system permease protein n=1 Tax=Agrococcus jejuensis TaxID=399736 RepID=A0A1G8DVV5_9MICO|nr:ABC transporter permease [Agrococcus jejuensis]SDH61559.1 peptide/nickel transport system permease protein [Agrococcus jejuensis]